MEASETTLTRADDAEALDFPPSALGNRWEIKPHDERQALTLMQQYELPEMVARLLSSRGIATEDVADFLNPTLKTSLPDPFHLKDMDKAAERVVQAVQKQQKIAIFGDYDVDGATSSALLKRFLRMLGVEPRIYIPDRLSEGYGLNTAALLKLREEGADLVITVDCGTVSHEPIAAAQQAGLDVIVIDHHLGGETLPDAVAVVNPNRLDETSPHRNLAAVGMAFLLAVAVNTRMRETADGLYAEPDLLSLLDLVALGTVCDVVSLTGVNRAFVAQGLKVMAGRRNIGLATLADVGGMDAAPGVYHAGFILGPRINAGGRIGKADLGSRLLTTENAAEALEIAQELDKLNRERQTIEQLVLEEATAQAELQHNKPFICVASEGWHQGVIGIVAGRLKELFGRPAAVIALEDGVGKGSARSIAGVDLGSAIGAARMEGLLEAGGGHAMAAGFTVAADRLDEFRSYMEEKLAGDVATNIADKQLKLEGVLGVGAVTPELAKSLEQIGPFGMGNPQPRFAITHAKMIQAEIVGQDHVRCIVGDASPGATGNVKLKTIAFRSANTPLGKALLGANYTQALHLAGKIKFDSWQGRKKAELIVDDVILLG